jgi:hypothetical protein
MDTPKKHFRHANPDSVKDEPTDRVGKHRRPDSPGPHDVEGWIWT